MCLILSFEPNNRNCRHQSDKKGARSVKERRNLEATIATSTRATKVTASLKESALQAREKKRNDGRPYDFFFLFF